MSAEENWNRDKKFFEENKFWKNVTHPIVIARKHRRYFLETRENRCSICKLTEWLSSPIPLVLDHIDGNSENWSLDNLRLICGNCDMLLPTYKNKNRGRGRKYRMDRYKKNKSF